MQNFLISSNSMQLSQEQKYGTNNEYIIRDINSAPTGQQLQQCVEKIWIALCDLLFYILHRFTSPFLSGTKSATYLRSCVLR